MLKYFLQSCFNMVLLNSVALLFYTPLSLTIISVRFFTVLQSITWNNDDYYFSERLQLEIYPSPVQWNQACLVIAFNWNSMRLKWLYLKLYNLSCMQVKILFSHLWTWFQKSMSPPPSYENISASVTISLTETRFVLNKKRRRANFFI